MNHGAWSVCDHSARADLLPLNGLRASQLNGMQVGPFRVLPDPVDTASTGFVLDTSEATYSVDLNSTALAGKVTAASRSGTLSAWSLVTMPGPDRQVAQIPLTATRFAFGYPLDDAQCANADDLIYTPAVSCCVLGFFIYVDRRGDVCGVCGLSNGDGLFFNGPFKLWTLRVPQLRQHLHDAQRVMPVSMPDLAQRGAQGFCWVGPAEHFGGLVEADVAKRSWAHGGFFYFFEDAKKDSYFFVGEAPQAAVDLRRASIHAERRAAASRG